MPKEKKNNKTKCPVCGQRSMEPIARGKNLRLMACSSDKCAKGPLNMTLFFQPGSNVPVVWELKPGQMHAIDEEPEDEVPEINIGSGLKS